MARLHWSRLLRRRVLDDLPFGPVPDLQERPPNRIQELRLALAKQPPFRRWTLAAIAREVGVTERTMWRWEQGLSRPYGRNAIELARVLGVQVKDLGLDHEPSGSPPES